MNTTTEIQAVGEATMITSDCIAIAFKRPTGTNPVNVSGYPLADGETLTISQNVGDIDRTQYQIYFGSGAGIDECYVFRTLIIDSYQNG
jgi:hypothetical protein